ncbi:hypothetical protein HDV00_011767 [Rhizophlyctis rosea]|nr:hypothetical protein HDV00_011767 [Rhizophlyctis rosea]
MAASIDERASAMKELIWDEMDGILDAIDNYFNFSPLSVQIGALIDDYVEKHPDNQSLKDLQQAFEKYNEGKEDETPDSVLRTSQGLFPCCADIKCSAGGHRRSLNRLYEFVEELVKIVKDIEA